MTPRNFDNWISAYLDYSEDGFTPSQFNLWSAMSAVAGALERKVWLPWSDTFSYYPNIYVLMVSLPGAGKSTALNKAIGLLQEMNARNNTMNIIPSQVTEAKFIELMGRPTNFEWGTKIIMQSCGYYWASEASNSLKNLFGDFIACLTDFYDCPPFWEKATMAGDRVTLRNVSLNLLAGSTFDYLSKLVTDENIMGGFASRLIYVVHRDKLVRKQKFQLGGAVSNTAERKDYRRLLVDDLLRIHKMAGPFTASPEFGEAWEAWYPDFEEKRQSNPSEKMQSLLVRTNTNLIKCAMLFSAARSDERVLRIEDWEAALTVVEPIAKEIPQIFRDSKALDVRSQRGVNQAIMKMLADRSEHDFDTIKGRLVMGGCNSTQVEQTVKAMLGSGILETTRISGKNHFLKLMINADEHI